MFCSPEQKTVEWKPKTKFRPTLTSTVLLWALVSVRLSAQVVTLTPSSLTFSSQVLNTTSASKTVTLKNTGKATLNITSMTTSGGFAATTCPATIAVGGSCQFTVTFTPEALGAIDGAVTIVDNATPVTQVVSLTGTGTAPVTFSVASLTFPSTPIGTTSAPKTVTLTNRSSSSLTMGAVSTSGDYNLSSNGCTGSVAAGGRCTIGVTFSPTNKGTIAGALTVGDSALFQPQAVGLSGTGSGTVTNTVFFTPTKLTFTQAVGTTSQGQTVTLKNTGATSLTVGTITASGNYLENDNCAGQTLNSTATCTITVQFQPSAYGTIAGAITVSDSATTTPQVVGLSGTGTGSFSFSPSSLNFFLQTLNLPSAPLTATLTNESGADIQFSSIAVSGDYSQTNNCGNVLPANSTCTFTVTYTPGTAGTTDGAITVTAGTGSFQVLSLSGSGINPTRYVYSDVQNFVQAYAADPSTGFLRITAVQTLPDVCSVGGPGYGGTVSPSGGFFYIPGTSNCQNGGPIGIFGYSIGANGQLTPITGSPFGVSTFPDQIVITPNGKFGYVTDTSSGVNIIPVSVNAKTGAVAQLPGTIAYPGNNLPMPVIDPASKFLFLTDVSDSEVWPYTINATTGALAPVNGSPFSTNENTGTFGIAVHPSGKFLFTVAGYPLSGVSVFKINGQTGALTLVPGSPFATDQGAFALALDPSGNFVYVGGGALTVFRLNATTGALTQVPGSPFPTVGSVSLVSPDPNGHFLYLSQGGSGGLIQTVAVNEQTGAITPVTTTGSAPFNGSLVGFTTGAKPVSFSDSYAYVANSPVTGISTQNGILQYSINSSTGVLTQVGSLYPVSNGPQVLALHPTKQELYSSEAGGVILGYSIGAGGALNTNGFANEPDTFPTYSIVSDPYGAFLFGTDGDPSGSRAIDAVAWQINSDGSLGSVPYGTWSFTGPGVAVAGFPSAYGVLAISSDGTLWGLYDASNTGAMWGSFAVGHSPSAVAFDGAGRFIYVANSGDNTISGFTNSAFSLNSLDGGVPFSTGTTPIAIAGDPSGRYLYVANAGSQNIWEYSIDPLSGNLTPLAVSPLSLGVSPNSLTMDYAGNFLYATNSAAGTVSVMSLNADGSLTLQGTTTVDSGATQSPAPTSIAVTGTAK